MGQRAVLKDVHATKMWANGEGNRQSMLRVASVAAVVQAVVGCAQVLGFSDPRDPERDDGGAMSDTRRLAGEDAAVGAEASVSGWADSADDDVAASVVSAAAEAGAGTAAEGAAAVANGNSSLCVPEEGMVEVAWPTMTQDCRKGWTPEGDAPVRVCQADGGWSGTRPICRPVDCGRLDAPQNGTVSRDGGTYGAVAIMQCAPGSAFPLPSTDNSQDGGSRPMREFMVTCQANGTWSPSPRRCVQLDCEWPYVPNGEVRLVNDDRTFGAVAYYQCRRNYVLRGIVEGQPRVCQADGTWSGPSPSCACNATGGLSGDPCELPL